MILHLFLDLDDTILDFRKSEHTALSAALREAGIAPTKERMARYSQINAEHWRLLECGRLTREQVLVQRFAVLFSEYGIAADAAKVEKRYEQFLSEQVFFMPQALQTLKELKAGGYHLYLITNGNASVQHRRLAKSGIAPLFEHIFISEEVGADKPSEAFFSYCFTRVGHFSKNEALVIGDSLSSDILGGNRAGVRTVWLSESIAAPENAAVKPDYILPALGALPALLKTL